MVPGKTVIVALLAALAIFAGLVWGKFRSEAFASSSSTGKQGDNKSLLDQLNDERIVAIHNWRIDDNEEKLLLCVVQRFDKDPQYDGSGVKLTIIDPTGATVYEKRYSEVGRVYSATALRNLSEQLVIEANYGGSTSFLHMLDFRNGKVVELIDAKESDFDVGAEVRPQFRSGVQAASEPFQIMLTHGVGLASPARKSTSVFRYKDGKYRRLGEFSQQQVDDYVERQLMTEPNKAKMAL